MPRSTRIKEAIKTGLAMAVVYWIAMRLGWMNPYWAAFAVAMISLPTQGQSLHKGVQRMGGTMVGCPAALLLHHRRPTRPRAGRGSGDPPNDGSSRWHRWCG